MLNSEIYFLLKSGGGLIHSLTPKRGTVFQKFDRLNNVKNQHLYFLFCYFKHKQYLFDSNHSINIYWIILKCYQSLNTVTHLEIQDGRHENHVPLTKFPSSLDIFITYCY